MIQDKQYVESTQVWQGVAQAVHTWEFGLSKNPDVQEATQLLEESLYLFTTQFVQEVANPAEQVLQAELHVWH